MTVLPPLRVLGWLDHLPAPDEAPELGWLVLRSLLVLAGLVALLYLVVRPVLRRALQAMPGPGRPAVQVLQRVGLDARHALVVVRAGSATLLLGTSAQGVQLLCRLEPEAAAVAEPAVAGKAVLERLWPAAPPAPREGV